MMKLKKSIFLMSIAVIAIAGCKKPKDGATGPAGATGPNGPSLSGTLEGYVDLFDQYGSLMSNASGVYITIAGKTGTDSTSAGGMFTKSLSTGTYELDLAKTGYGSLKVPSLNFVGGGTQYIAGHLQLTQPASFSLSTATSATVTVGGASAVSVTVTPSSTDTKARKVICFLSTSSSVSYAPSSYVGTVLINIPANATTGSGNITTAVANSIGITTGTTMYVAAYPISVSNGASTYGDIATGKTVYNNINPLSSATTNIVFP